MDQLKTIILSVNGETLNSTISFLTLWVQDETNERVIIRAVNDLLTNIKTRKIGLEMVAGLIEHCSADVLVENSFSWLNSCIECRGEERILKLDITEKLIRTIGLSESFAKKFSSEYLRDILRTCLSYANDIEKQNSLKCLCQCFEKFSDGITTSRDQVEKFLLQFLENASENYVEDASIAFHYFIQTGNPGFEGINYINNFRHHFLKLCETVLDLYKIYFKRIQEDSQNDENLEVLTNEIVNKLIFIRTMIRKNFSVEKQINIKKLINVIKEGLSKHTCSLEGNATLCLRRFSILKKIQLQLLYILQVFITGNVTSLLPYSHIMMNILLNCLKKSTICMHCNNDLFYKDQLYRTLRYWLQLSNSANDVYIQETLVSILLSNFTSAKKNTYLTLNISRVYGLQKGCDRSYPHSTVEAKKKEICLEVLKSVLTEYPIKINEMLWQELMTHIMQDIHNEYAYCESEHFSADNPCVSNLYYILISLLKRGNMEYIPSRHFLISLLKKGINNPNNKVSRAAYEGLKSIEALSHSVAYSFCDNDQKLCNSDFIRNYDKNKSKSIADDFRNNEKSTVGFSLKEMSITKKEINILSDIVITKSRSKDDNGKNDNVIETIRNDQTSRKKKGTFIGHCQNVESVHEAKSEEPAEKKIKPQSNILHAMIGAFEDMVQCQ